MKKEDLFIPYIKDKTVLDMGCIQHSWKVYKTPTWLHSKLLKDAKKVVGLDYLKKDCEILQKKGFDIRYGDAQDFDFKEKFDVLIAGDLIEHLSNFGGFLESCKKHMKKDSVLLITTPNAFCIGNMIRPFFKTFGIYDVNPEHTCWFDYQTLKQLVERHKFKIDDFYTFWPDNYPTILDKIPSKHLKTTMFIALKK